jgi:putative Mg2+ transporter-C (MgtC) family protein
MNWLAQIEVLGEVVLAVILGGLIGLEREIADKPAGLRTHMLVAVSATMLVALGNTIVANFRLSQYMQADPVRIIEATIVGISFLGTGTILQREKRGKIEGLTTAASVLAVATIGVAVALRLFFLSVGTTLFILLINRVVNGWEKRLNRKVEEKNLGG